MCFDLESLCAAGEHDKPAVQPAVPQPGHHKLEQTGVQTLENGAHTGIQDVTVEYIVSASIRWTTSDLERVDL